MASKVSIITINLNNRDGLKRTIDSVITQTFDDYEYLVIDGGSSDGSIDLIKEDENKIAYWVSEPDNGIYHAMNKGIKQANGDYLLFLNSGDYLINKTILQKVIDFDNNYDIVYGDGQFEAKNGKLTPIIIPEKLNLEYLFSSSLCHPSTFIKKCLFFNYGLYNESFSIVSDWDFFLRTIICNNIKAKKIPLTISTVEDEGISRSEKSKAVLMQEIGDCRKSHFPEAVIDMIEDYTHLKTNLGKSGKRKLIDLFLK